MQTFLNDVVDPAIITFVTALVAYLLKVGLPALVDVLLKSRAASLVKAAESIYAGQGLGTAKYQYVVDGLSGYAKSLLVKVPDVRVRGYIEAAVTQLHADLPQALQLATAQIKAAPATTSTTQTK